MAFIFLVGLIAAYLWLRLNLGIRPSAGAIQGLCGFAVGVLLYPLIESFSARADSSQIWAGAWAALGCLGALFLFFGHAYTFSGIYILSIGLIGFFCMAGSSPFVKACERLGKTWFGNVSYGIYMWHGIVLWVISRFLCQIMKFPYAHANGRIWIDTPAAIGNAMLLITYLVTIALAFLSFKYVEAPLRNYLRPPKTSA